MKVKELLLKLQEMNPDEEIFVGIETKNIHKNIYLETNKIQTIIEITDGLLIRGVFENDSKRIY